MEDDLPFISILLAVYNEEKVIQQKIESTLQTSYPPEKIEWLIGLDKCSDRTAMILRQYENHLKHLKLIHFEERMGKIAIINQLAEEAKGEIFIFTDANVFFTRETLYNLVKHYKEQHIALVAGNILNPTIKSDGISRQESSYQILENRLKYNEGILWGAMMGAFGGCYSMRKRFFLPTPVNFLVDDFYITMGVIEQGGKAINELDAICYEDVSNKITEEFRRKTRIAAGNFQNFARFIRLLSPYKGGVAFAFWSHKVLRWLGPLLLILCYLSSFVLSSDHQFYRGCFWIQTFLFMLPVLDLVLRKLKIHFFGLRYISHFYLMNLALLTGFFKYLIGVKDNVWEPTERNQ